ncbi:MAG: glycosyltransferase family 2 protein [Candidatus Gottesmanbacteria bacterium]|nr:glycosyltransferase family 2 protein [Candidatus Gottesmanbacteria bacterium]
MDLSIIIPSYNTSALLERCLTSIYKSLRKSEITFEVIVVDNASTDGTPEVVRSQFSHVHLVRNKENVGYGKANNQGISGAKGTYILLLNSDTVAKDDAIGGLYRFIMKKHHAFVGGKLLNEDGSTQSSCGPFFTIIRVFLMLFVRGDYWGVTRYSPTSTRVVDWVSGACLMGRKTDFMQIGLFDEGIFMYMEDIDFLYRARIMDFRAWFYPDAQFIHVGAASSKSRKTPVVNIFRGLVYFYKKYYGIIQQMMLHRMLRGKALAAIIVGRMIGKPGIVQTYEEALRVL